MLNKLLRLRRLRGDARAVRGGPKSMGKRFGRKLAYRAVNRIFR